MRKKSLFKKLVAGVMAIAMIMPAWTINSNAATDSSTRTTNRVTGLVNIAATNEKVYYDYCSWKSPTVDYNVADITETMDYCNPLVSKNYYCIDLDGTEYVTMAEECKQNIETYTEQSQVDILNASYKKYIKANQNKIAIGYDTTFRAAEQAVRIANGCEVDEYVSNKWQIWTYNGYAPEQSSKHPEAMEKWNEAREVLKEFCKEHENVIYGFAFAVPNVNYSKEDMESGNYMSWRDMQGTYVLLYKEINKTTFDKFYNKASDLLSLNEAKFSDSLYDGDYNIQTFNTDYTPVTYAYEEYLPQSETLPYYTGFGPNWQSGVNYLAKGDTKDLSLLQHESKEDRWEHGVSEYTGAVEWTSSNTKVATVSDTGLVTAKKNGTVTITAKCNGISYKCRLSVFEKGKKTEKKTYTSTKKKKLIVRLNDMKGVKEIKWNNPSDTIFQSVSKSLETIWYDEESYLRTIIGRTDYYHTKVIFRINDEYYEKYKKDLEKGRTFNLDALVTYKDGSTETVKYTLVFKK